LLVVRRLYRDGDVGGIGRVMKHYLMRDRQTPFDLGALTEEVLGIMFLGRRKVATATLLVVFALATGGTGLAFQAQAVKPSQEDGLQRQSEPPRLGDAHRRAVITPHNVASLAPIASLAKDDLWRIAWSPARDRMGLVGWEAPVEVRGVVSLALHDTIGAGKKIIHFAFSPRRGVVAYSENDGSRTATIVHRAPVSTIRVDAGNDQPDVVFSPDGHLLATGGYGTAVRLWRVEDGRLTRTIDAGPAVGGLTPAFSPDGRLLAIGNRNSTTGIFDVATGDLLFRLEKKSSHELRFSPDGRTLAVVYVDGSVALWKVADGSLIVERETQAKELYTVDWSPDGSLLATAGLNGPITIWAPRDLSVLRELQAPEWVIQVKFTPDGFNLHWAGGASRPQGERRLEILGIKG
jgi:Eukaryotic translation initiation factor eIF2A/WD domain, G-beta repeat